MHNACRSQCTLLRRRTQFPLYKPTTTWWWWWLNVHVCGTLIVMFLCVISMQNSNFLVVFQLVHYPGQHCSWRSKACGAMLVKFAQATLCLLNSATLISTCAAYFRHELYNVMSETHAHRETANTHSYSLTHVSLHSFDHVHINTNAKNTVTFTQT